MGVIKTMLCAKELSGEAMFHDKLRIEGAADGTHFHWRDVRLIMDNDNYATFYHSVIGATELHTPPFNKDTLLDEKILSQSLFLNRVTIEEQESGCIHFHYNDMRIEMSPERFLMIARAFEQAHEKYMHDRIVVIPIEKINPYDGGHFESEQEWHEYDKRHPERTDDFEYHQKGIKFAMNGILNGFKIRPIPVIKIENKGCKYQRIDGFKRHMAYKRLQKKEIPCYICDPAEAMPGVQDGQSMFLT